MKISEGTKLAVNDKRRGSYFAIANSDFDTNDEWYDILLDQPYLNGLSNTWIKGENIPARKGIAEIYIRTN